jgi:hypothetical protein
MSSMPSISRAFTLGRIFVSGTRITSGARIIDLREQ